jgi:hypothetical protein
MYASLKSKEGQTVLWPQSVPPEDSYVKAPPPNGPTIGTFSASANTVAQEVLGIVSEGNVNGRKAKVVVKYGFSSPYTSGPPIGSAGAITLYGRGIFGLRSWVRAEGPVESGSTVTRNSYVRINGEVLENQSISVPSFWVDADGNPKMLYDTNGNGSRVIDQTGDGAVTIADCTTAGEQDPEKVAIFRADNVYHPGGDDTYGPIDESDAFYQYYTHDLNTKYALGLAPGEANYYSGDQTFGPGSVPEGSTIIFVNGDVNILFNDQNWSGGARDHTIVSMNDIAIVQPTNGSDDRLTLIAYRDVATGGVRAFGGVRGTLVVYAHDDFAAYYGGRTNGTIFANDSVYVDTVFPVPGLLNRDLNRAAEDWSDPAEWPMGLPPGYPTSSLSFRIKSETAEYRPVWTRD